MGDVSGESKGSTTSVMVGLGAIGGSIILISLLAAPFLVVPASRKLGSLPWMATPKDKINLALEHVERIRLQTLAHGGVKRALCQQSNHSTVRSLVDLGAGDGRVCIEAAKYHGYKATGIELNPVLIALSYYRALQAGTLSSTVSASTGLPIKTSVLSQVTFRMTDFWAVPLASFDVITVFGVRSIMERLETKLTEEAAKDLFVVCYRFPLPSKQPVYSKDELFIYHFSPKPI
eukprot:gene13169-15177_t